MKAAHSIIVSLVLHAVLAAGALAHWDPETPSKWVQLPDQTTNGLDVSVSLPDGTPRMLADDFLCESRGYVTNVHVWVSWRHDQLIDPNNVQFVLRFWSDNPQGLGHASAPEELLWDRMFTPGEFTAMPWLEGLEGGEGWYNPAAQPPLYEPNADSNIWLYNFSIPIEEAFLQKGSRAEPVVYWLGVFMSPQGGAEAGEIGWKTSTNHWNDDAVWGDMQPGGPGVTWRDELYYPDGHPYHNLPYPENSINLAFVIESGPPPREPKWSQPLDMEHALNVESFVYGDSEVYTLDDFISDGRPITAIRWWGSYKGHRSAEPPTGAPVPPPDIRPDGFWVDWLTDIPAGAVTNYSMPGASLADAFGTLLPPGTPGAGPGEVSEHYCTSILHTAGSTAYWEHEYVYEMVLPEEWREKAGQAYWLGIEAEYAEDPPAHPWGWATTPPRYHWNDDAVQDGELKPLPEEIDYYELFYSDLMPGHPYDTNSVDLAFELLTDVIGRRAVKWRQMPDMTSGVDMASWTIEGLEDSGFLRADDFISDGRLITDIHWWGSYIGWEKAKPYSQTNPPPPTHPVAPNGFNLSWHADGGGQPLPGPAIVDVFVPFTACHEVFYGSVTQANWEAGVTNYEHEFQYYVDLRDPDLKEHGVGPWPEEEGQLYWLNIQAVYEDHEGEYPWGWKITTNITLNPSAVRVGIQPWQPALLGYWTGHPRFGEPFDLAFELTTDEVGTNAWYAPIVITNMARLAADTWLVESVGDWGSGTQYLQECDDLMTTNWAEVDTNALPWPPPARNPWYPPVTARSNRMFRVLQKK